MSVLSTQEVGKLAVDLGLISREQLIETLGELVNPTADDLLRHLERRSLLSSYQIRKLERGETTGYKLGRFKILYKVAAGTFARVFRGVDTLTNESVAIKVLRGRHTIDPETIRHFHREAKLFESLRHPNIARMLEVGVDPATKQHYIAMEFVEGGNLREFLRIRGVIKSEEMPRFASEMVEGLRYALSRGVTHRDIKPTNILIAANGQIKWVDFGLAGQVEIVRNNVSYNSEQRTVDYAGLEKATGAPKGDPRSDIFFLGAVFHLMLTGESPLVETKDRNARMLRTRFDQIPSLGRFESIPREWVTLVDKMLAFHPERRYQDYDAILKDLERIKQLANQGGVDTEIDSDQPIRVMVIHNTPHVQDLLKRKLVERGFQVVLTMDMSRAISLHDLKPADCLIVDLNTTGQDGIDEFRRLLNRSSFGHRIGGVFLATEEQKHWTEVLNGAPAVTLLKPLTLGSVYKAVLDLVPRRKKST